MGNRVQDALHLHGDCIAQAATLRQQAAILEAEIRRLRAIVLDHELTANAAAEVRRLQQELAALRLKHMAAVNQLTGQY